MNYPEPNATIKAFDVLHAFRKAFEATGGRTGKPLGPIAYSGEHAVQVFQKCTMVWDGRLHIINWEL